MTIHPTKLKMLTPAEYTSLQLDNPEDPIQIYFRPLVGGFYRKRVELCLNELNPAKRILEIGYGSGVAFLNLHDKFSEIYGLDLISPSDRVTTLYQKLGIDVKLRKGDVLNMPYPNEFFDCVFAVSIFEHLKPDEQKTAMQEIQRVLRRGGQLVYGVPVSNHTMSFLYKLLGYNINEYHFSSEGDVDRAASSIFKKIRIKNLYAFPGFIQLYQMGHFLKYESA
jgi:ubiquinone/menaquinone biosynthesis C-methylase UbiE